MYDTCTRTQAHARKYQPVISMGSSRYVRAHMTKNDLHQREIEQMDQGREAQDSERSTSETIMMNTLNKTPILIKNGIQVTKNRGHRPLLSDTRWPKK